MTVSPTVPMSPPWASDLRSALGARPVPLDAIEARVGARHGQVDRAALQRELCARGDVYEAPDGWVDLISAANGVVLTHVLCEHERSAGVLDADGDLDLWARLADEGLPLTAGGDLHSWMPGPSDPRPHTASTVLLGPTGWLDCYEPGQILALRLRAGVLGVEQVELREPDDASAARSALIAEGCSRLASAALSRYLDDEGDLCWALLDEAVAALVVTHPDALAEPLPPLSSMLRDARLQCEHGFVALPGVPPISETDDFHPGEIGALVFAHLTVARLETQEHEGTELLSRLLAVLAVPVVAEQIADSVERSPLPEPVLGALIEAAGTDVQRGHALLLAARSAEGNGDYRLAEQLVDEASRLVPDCHPVASDAAGYAAARGDVVRADDVLRAAGCSDDDLLRQALQPLLKLPEGEVSRNRPCPCRSGRKYKACCLRDVVHPLPRRAPLAFARLLAHAQRPAVFGGIAGVFDVVEPAARSVALDLGIFEGGVAADYLACRGHLLPVDERDLVRSWIDTQLAPYEVADLRPGRSVTLRPLLGGASVVLSDRLFSSSVDRLDVLVARVLSDGQGPVMMSLPARVHRLRRAPLLALFDDEGGYDTHRLATFFGPQPAPVLRNRDGEDLVFCEATYSVDDEDESAWSRLSVRLRHDHHDEERLVLAGVEESDGEYLVRGSVSRAGTRWVLETNSLERLRELQAMVHEAAPDAVHVSESTRPAEDVLAEDHDEPPPALVASGAGGVDLSSPEYARVLDEYMQSHEHRWLDEVIPALGGVTPRDAVARGGRALAELLALLDDMEWMSAQSSGGMDADRIRGHLGLTATARPRR